jgi:hypothetical protein
MAAPAQVVYGYVRSNGTSPRGELTSTFELAFGNGAYDPLKRHLYEIIKFCGGVLQHPVQRSFDAGT